MKRILSDPVCAHVCVCDRDPAVAHRILRLKKLRKKKGNGPVIAHNPVITSPPLPLVCPLLDCYPWTSGKV